MKTALLLWSLYSNAPIRLPPIWIVAGDDNCSTCADALEENRHAVRLPREIERYECDTQLKIKSLYANKYKGSPSWDYYRETCQRSDMQPLIRHHRVCDVYHCEDF